MKTIQLDLPRHWACALMYGDADWFDPKEERAFNRFTDWMLDKYGMCMCIDVEGDECGDFRCYHDATEFGALACDVATFTFNIGE